MSKLETYAWPDEKLEFVVKLERDPKSERGHRQTALWLYCCSRWQQRWVDAKPRRSIPAYHGEGGIGWWFPTAWVEDFRQSEVRAKP